MEAQVGVGICLIPCLRLMSSTAEAMLSDMTSVLRLISVIVARVPHKVESMWYRSTERSYTDYTAYNIGCKHSQEILWVQQWRKHAHTAIRLLLVRHELFSPPVQASSRSLSRQYAVSSIGLVRSSRISAFTKALRWSNPKDLSASFFAYRKNFSNLGAVPCIHAGATSFNVPLCPWGASRR